MKMWCRISDELEFKEERMKRGRKGGREWERERGREKERNRKKRKAREKECFRTTTHHLCILYGIHSAVAWCGREMAPEPRICVTLQGASNSV